MSLYYTPDHGDWLTGKLRDASWIPASDYHCGCSPTVLCSGHAKIRAAEHYNPELIPAHNLK